MARKPRDELAGGVHHVWARGNARGLVFRDDRDRRTYLALLARVVRWKRWRCLAYCLMDNHTHLLVETPHPNLGRGVQWLHGHYARLFNDRHGRSGHVFQGRFGSKLATSDEQLWHAAAYVVRNPVEAGLCAHPRDWEWSSYAATLAAPRPRWLDAERLLGTLPDSGRDPVRRYEELVNGTG
ncbi:MAG TPA: transposase [Thermoleophilaceae bacterium]|jgi:REP element-mobilizing transposase RayT